MTIVFNKGLHAGAVLLIYEIIVMRFVLGQNRCVCVIL